ncbi:ThiF family adenylyltransferase [Lunatibacter salilacus]|uniref:ThiF family adenylyltransferase n=1 Tax=Lunatibacter salilacus TaxID=2483804 RepID=UPI00131D68D6|nr:ThiF family adenylyltransferase [Lunatibacter salilacus]
MNNSGSEDELSQEYVPIILSPRNPADIKTIKQLKKNVAVLVFDTITSQVDELSKIDNPTIQMAPGQLLEMRQKYYSERQLTPEEVGNWIYYPWRKTLIRILEEDEFIRLRTSRNKYKITHEEQALLSKKKIGVIGLSVGQSVAVSLAMERCFGELRIADFDTLDLSNVNRIRTGLFNLGLKKTTIVAREISEIDPYLKVTLFNEGINEQNIHDFFTLGGEIDVLVEECDSLAIKIASRVKAKALQIPVLMDTSDRGMMDIERFDLQKDRPIFHGLLEAFGDENQLLYHLPEKAREMMMSLLQFENLSDRVKYSFSEIGKSITTWPQLASSVIMGGAACCHYCRMILLKQPVESGRFYIDLELLINSHEG